MFVRGSQIKGSSTLTFFASASVGLSAPNPSTCGRTDALHARPRIYWARKRTQRLGRGAVDAKEAVLILEVVRFDPIPQAFFWYSFYERGGECDVAL